MKEVQVKVFLSKLDHYLNGRVCRRFEMFEVKKNIKPNVTLTNWKQNHIR